MGRVWGCFAVIAVLAAACTSGLNPRQERAWDDFHACRSVAPTARIVELQKNGMLRYQADGPEIGPMEACMKERGRWSRNLEPQRPEPTFPSNEQEADFEWLKEHKLKAQAPSVSARVAEAHPSPAVSPPVWERGYEWTYRWESPRGQGTFVWSVDREQIVDDVAYYVVKIGEGRKAYLRKTDLAFYMDTVGEQVELRYIPPRARYAWPLLLGKAWENTSTRETPGDRQTSVLVEACQAGAQESVAVPAGTFSAYRVTCRSLRTGTINFESWYSPEVKHYVRERTRLAYGIRERELIAFKLGSP